MGGFRIAIKAVSLVVIAVLCPAGSHGQSRPETELTLGSVTEKVAVQSNPGQSYAAFLPTRYTPEKRWPTIFCLDPRARGKAAAEKFKAAAEKYGYVVVCSNNSRNGLDAEAVKNIMNDFWRDAHERLSIDENRTYFAGFSGGSRLAAAFAVGCRGCVAGVLASGAGFPANLHPDSQTRFVYFGVVGVDDFNYGEMRELEKTLSSLPAPFHFQTFDAGHEWPPQSSLEDALAWFNLQAIRAGTLERDGKFLDQQYAVRVTEAERLLAAGQSVDSQRAFLSIARDFQDLRDVKPVAEKLEQLKKSAELRKEEQLEGELIRRQQKEVSEIRTLWLKGPLPEESSAPRYEANIRLSDWRKKKEASSDSRERRLARRILSHLLIESYEAAQSSLRQQKDYAQAISNYQLARAIEPRSSNLAYELGRVYALNRDKKAALRALDEAVALGFKDQARIKSDEAFAVLAGEARFQKLLLGMN